MNRTRDNVQITDVGLSHPEIRSDIP